jgi:radical SAM protein with 4Fe4S-binding SPASM domain
MSNIKLNINSQFSTSFGTLKKILKNDAFRYRAHKLNKTYSPKLPPELAIQLTYRCNLRCHSCMQWSNNGFLNLKVKKEIVDLDLNIFQMVLYETRKEKSILHLWGGEPLFHNDWDEISKLIEKDKRQIVLNTNGLLIEEKIESLLKVGSDLILVISLDGNQEDNDKIRGKGTFNKIIQTIILLEDLKKRNLFKGRIIVNTVLNEQLALSLSEFVMKIDRFAVDKLILNFPWYISDIGISIMDKYFLENFDWLNIKNKKSSEFSWHYFQYSFPEGLIPMLKKQINEIQTNKLSMKLRIQPNIEPAEVLNITNCNYPPKYINNSFCLGTYNRASICADGNVSACPDFPEFVMGSLKSDNLINIWNSPDYLKLRTIRNNGMWPLPICFKCSLFSLNRI